MAFQIEHEDQLDELLTRPSNDLVSFISGIEGPLLVLGASGKMGPTLAVRARRAGEECGRDLQVIAVSRFSDSDARRWLEERGVTTVSCDLLDRADISGLPDAANVIYMAGRKFGTVDNPSLTWAMNTLAPSYVCERYSDSRIVALSTGCVYPFVPVESGGSCEEDPLTPLGEYANASVARERIFEYHSLESGTRISLIRLNYAVELRYGVLVDIARTVYERKPVDVGMGYVNCIWQGDANDMIVRALDLTASPARPINLTGAETLSVRALAERFGDLMGLPVEIVGHEAPTALLSNSVRSHELLGPPSMSIESVVEWTAQWIASGGRLLGKPTHFESTDGRY